MSTSAVAQIGCNTIRHADQHAERGPQHDCQSSCRQYRSQEHHHRCIDPTAQPRDGNLPRPIGEPDGAERQEPQKQEIEDDPNHRAGPSQALRVRRRDSLFGAVRLKAAALEGNLRAALICSSLPATRRVGAGSTLPRQIAPSFARSKRQQARAWPAVGPPARQARRRYLH